MRFSISFVNICVFVTIPAYFFAEVFDISMLVATYFAPSTELTDRVKNLKFTVYVGQCIDIFLWHFTDRWTVK